jgi:hypothetical protein
VTQLTVLRSLRERLRGGDKSLVGNSAYRRYLKTPDDKHFEIDEEQVGEDARYDGLYVLRTNMRLERSPSCCGIASCSRWGTFSGAPNRSSTPGQSITKPTKLRATISDFLRTCTGRHGKFSSHEATGLHDAARRRGGLAHHGLGAAA